MAVAKKARESSPQAKGSSATLVADSKVDKSSPAGDANVSILLNTNFLSSPFACFKLVDHIYQASNLDTFSSGGRCANQAGGAAESVADQANAEETAD
ncbi:unnamed protein product [Prunus armeniaca]